MQQWNFLSIRIIQRWASATSVYSTVTSESTKTRQTMPYARTIKRAKIGIWYSVGQHAYR
jgi:hypothetical protein